MCGEGEDKPQYEVRALIKVIEKIRADILLLQEVGSLETLTRLNANLKSPYPHLACVPGNSLRNIHLAVVSRFPIDVTSHRHALLTDAAGQPLLAYPDEQSAKLDRKSAVGLQRDVLQVEVADLTLFGVHLKSKGSPAWQCVAADQIRRAEAVTVAAIVRRYHDSQGTRSSRGAMLMGDFNDLASADCLAALAALGWSDPHELRYRELGRNPSTYWPKRRMRLDRMLVSLETVGRVMHESATIYSGELFRRASDHYPVTLDLE